MPNSKMNPLDVSILQVTSAHDRGDIRIVKKITNSLAAHYEVNLMVADGLPSEILFNGVKVWSVKKRSSRIKRFTLTPFNLFFEILKIKPDLVHLHDPELIHIGVILRLLGYKVIYDSHENLPEQIIDKPYLNKYIATALSMLVRVYEVAALRPMTAVVCATDSIAVSLGTANKTCVVINNYPIVSKIETKNRDRFTAVYVGGISRVRGIVELISALEYSKVIQEFRLIGSFNEDGLLDEVKELKGWQKVKYLGQLSYDEARIVLRQSEVGIITFLPIKNHINSRPNKLFEYMENGLAILASNFDSWEDLINEVECGNTVNPTNPLLIAKTLDSLLLSNNLAEMGNKGYKMVTGSLNWDVEAAKLIELYRKIL